MSLTTKYAMVMPNTMCSHSSDSDATLSFFDISLVILVFGISQIPTFRRASAATVLMIHMYNPG
jgi:hypothetical protein